MDDNFKIIVIEDEKLLCNIIQRELTKNGFNIDIAMTGKEAIKWAKENKKGLMLIDYKLPDMNAISVIKEIKKNNYNIFFIIITANGDIKIAVELMKLGVKDYLIKDSNFITLLPAAIKRVLEEINNEIRLNEAKEALYRSEESYRLLAESMIDVILMTDVDFKVIYSSETVEKLIGYTPEEMLVNPIEKIMSKESFKLINEYYKKIYAKHKIKNRGIPKCELFELEQFKKNGAIIWTEMRISLMFDTKQKFSGFFIVIRDISTRKLAEIKLKESIITLHNALKSSIEAMGKTTEIRDPYTAGHQKQVSLLAYEIAKEMDLSEDTCEGVKLAGAVHDIGKIFIPTEILSKPGKLTDIEFNIIKMHPQVGYDILKTIEFPWPIAQAVLQHHERINGSGYPKELKGNDILIEAKILGVADVVEAMASFRPYRPALGLDKALNEVKNNKGILYDPKVVEACISVIKKKKFELN